MLKVMLAVLLKQGPRKVGDLPIGPRIVKATERNRDRAENDFAPDSAPILRTPRAIRRQRRTLTKTKLGISYATEVDGRVEFGGSDVLGILDRVLYRILRRSDRASNVTFELIGSSLELEVLVTENLSRDLLELAFYLLSSALDGFFVHGKISRLFDHRLKHVVRFGEWLQARKLLMGDANSLNVTDERATARWQLANLLSNFRG